MRQLIRRFHHEGKESSKVGVILRRMLTNKMGARGLRTAEPYLFITRYFGMISTLIILFALKGHIILDHPGWVLLMALPIGIFLCFTFSLVFLTSRYFRFNYEDSVAIAFSCPRRSPFRPSDRAWPWQRSSIR